MQVGYPPIIVRDKEKGKYYKAFKTYRESQNKNIKDTEKVLRLSLLESLHKRIAYLKGQRIITLTEYVDIINMSQHTLLNKAKRQTVPAFREKGVWKIGV
jgi:hypothetical protein